MIGYKKIFYDAPGMDDAQEEENEGQEENVSENRKQVKKPPMRRYRTR